MVAVHQLSLIDTVDRVLITSYVCYCNAENPRWWNQVLKPGFQHVQIRQQIQYGPEPDDIFWLVLDPGLSHIETRLHGAGGSPLVDPDVLYTQRVQSVLNVRRVREWFFFGPITCTEVVKAALGISSWRVRTPWQLYNYLRSRDCVLR